MFKISKAEFNDLEEILILQKKAFLSQAIIYNDCSIPPMLQTVEEIQLEFNNKIFFKAVSSNKIVGSVRAGVIDKTCHIEKLMTDPDYRKNGIGKTLLLEIEKYFDTILCFELFTGLKSRSNIRLYESLGYREIARSIMKKNIEIVHMRKVKSSKQGFEK